VLIPFFWYLATVRFDFAFFTVSVSSSVSEDKYSSLLPILRGVVGPGVEETESLPVFLLPWTPAENC